MSGIKRCGNKTISELIDEEEKIVRELKNAEQNLHIIRNKKKQLTGKQQTRRLCNHGRLIEYFLPPDKYTDGQMLLILEELFEDPRTKEMLKEFEGIDLDVSHMKKIFY